MNGERKGEWGRFEGVCRYQLSISIDCHGVDIEAKLVEVASAMKKEKREGGGGGGRGRREGMSKGRKERRMRCGDDIGENGGRIKKVVQRERDMEKVSEDNVGSRC